MKIITFILTFFIISLNALSRGIGETEITTDDGIEVFQNEKYYLLKKNVKIVSDDFEISADNVKANFEEDLYDIISIHANGNSILNAKKYGLYGNGIELFININSELIKITGKDSFLSLENTKMFSDGSVTINNSTGSFELLGENSKLQTEDMNIFGRIITGIFFENNGKKQITKLNVEDNDLLTIKTENLEMNSQKATYDEKSNIIELFSQVKIIKGKEIIYGDYGFFDTNNKSYKVKSKNSSKVKVIISDSNE